MLMSEVARFHYNTSEKAADWKILEMSVVGKGNSVEEDTEPKTHQQALSCKRAATVAQDMPPGGSRAYTL